MRSRLRQSLVKSSTPTAFRETRLFVLGERGTRELDDGVDTPHDTVLRALECTRARGRARSRCEGRRVATQTTRRRAERR